MEGCYTQVILLRLQLFDAVQYQARQFSIKQKKCISEFLISTAVVYLDIYLLMQTLESVKLTWFTEMSGTV